MKLMLRHKIMGMACIAALLPTTVMLLLAGIQRSRVSAAVRDDLDSLTQDSIRQLALDAYHSCEAANDFIQQEVVSNLKVAEKIVKSAGTPRLSSEKVEWHAVNQYTDSVTAATLPKLTLGGTWIAPNSNPAIPSPVVDEVRGLVGGACTIFQKLNEQGDMLRIATTIRTAANTRAVGTYIPAYRPDGSPDPVVSVVSRGETFHGRAYVVNDWYISAYQPILDGDKKIVGMLFVGVEQSRVAGLRSAITSVKVGKTGQVYVIGGQDQSRGRVVVPREGYHDGDQLWEARDIEGRLYVQSMVKKALVLKKDEVAFERFMQRRESDAAPRMVTNAIAYFEPWDWIIIADAYEEEFHGARDKLESSLSNLFWWSVASGLCSMVVALIVASFLTGKITVPIEQITSVAQQIARGDLKTATESIAEESSGSDGGSSSHRGVIAASQGDDETGQLLGAVQTMTRSLNSLVGQVKQSSIQLVSTSTEIAAAARQQEVTANDLGASTNEVVAATREISATSQELLGTMNDVTQMAGSTASLAGSGRSGLWGMEANMRQLVDATRTISSRLAVISDKANNINSVVTTITKVADETNLLSLNAAIEAEKAGEYGLGFSVVAREIRRLADQTAVATLDIEQMMKEMRSAVSAGVMEMDRFGEEVRRNVADVGKISEQLETIISQVQALTPRFESVNHGMRVQAQGAEQISKAMVGLSDSTRQTADSLKEFNRAAEHLNEAARGLRNEVSRFNVND
ncbi:MAG TPA: methyl-accepting chemotaxis protein [Acidobacteriota bacterium]|nr:methyl-accepting chemotaxis protein [Acidobacteriota bacterium]